MIDMNQNHTWGLTRTDNGLEWGRTNLQSAVPSIRQMLAEKFKYNGPFYLMHAGILKSRLNFLTTALKDVYFYYSVKSQSNGAFLKIIRENDKFGIDVVSGGEIYRGLKAGFSPDRIVFAGVGKSQSEIEYGLDSKIRSFHVESIQELTEINNIAHSKKLTAPVALRLNPDIQVDTHEFIQTGTHENKFGISQSELAEAVNILRHSNNLKLIGLQCHLGSQIKDPNVYLRGLNYLNTIAGEIEILLEKPVEYLSIGGGMGIDYSFTENIFQPDEFNLNALAEILKKSDSKYPICMEPGRFISAYCGLLVGRVLFEKHKTDFRILITDTAMTELIRPALYGASHPVIPLEKLEGALFSTDVVGPVCESSDFIAKKINLPLIKQGDTLLIMHTGAYGSAMGSNYNSRPLIPEIMLEGSDSYRLVRRPQTIQDLVSPEEGPWEPEIFR